MSPSSPHQVCSYGPLNMDLLGSGPGVGYDGLDLVGALPVAMCLGAGRNPWDCGHTAQQLQSHGEQEGRNTGSHHLSSTELCVRHCSKCFTCINSFSPHKIPQRGRQYFCNLCSGEIETLGRLLITARLVSHRTGIWTQAVWLRTCTVSPDSLSVPVTLSWVPAWLSLATWYFQGCVLVIFYLPISP